MTRTDKYGYLFLVITFIYSLYLGFTDVDFFNDVFTVEDGTVEYGTAIMLLCISILSFYRLFTTGRSKSWYWKLGVFACAVVFLFGAGEEISWGQRIFDIQSGEYFLENNAQGETNLHNLVVGGKKINKIIFSQLLMVGMVIYLLVLPIFYRRNAWIKKMADRFALPIVKWHHTIAFIVSTLIVALIPADRKWEVYELAFGVVFFLIFLNPLNAFIFSKGEDTYSQA
ncbi:hypothetical protein [Robertkochia solimangrovi]|uniref:hypothetical protein n=1 Tax=Robertkochia solimangrovi TaxID=2213046 RepID=UPI00117FBB01|nr:hypothetical protein [Robertkochia solimangrovi]TRZ42802.1 hypothetical protein DMZ48_12085 [Robertkochia solimangrovi]